MPNENVIRSIPIDQIDDSPLNHRKIFNGIDELAKSLAEKGVEIPVCVRPGKSGRFELVYGHRRKRAALIAKLNTLPCLVKEIDDATVIQTQLIENIGGEPPHPLEEATAFDLLHTKHGHAVESIAANCGKSEGYVRKTLKLCSLAPDAKKLYAEGKITSFGAALAIARIPDMARQVAAAKEIASGGRNGNGEPMTAARASEYVLRNYMLELKEANFDVKDAALVPAAGACTKCPKRTGAQPQLFTDIVGKDICTDPGCYQGKVDALFQIKVAKAKDGGAKIIQGAAAKVLFDPWGDRPALRSDVEYVDLDKEMYEYGNKTFRQLLRLKKDAVAPIVAQDPSGNMRDLLPKGELKSMLRAAGVTKPQTDASGRKVDPKEKEQRRVEKQREKLHAEVIELASPRIREAAKKSKPAAALLRVVAIGSMGRFGMSKEQLDILGVKGVKEAEKATITEAQAQQLVVGHLIDETNPHGDDYPRSFKALAELFGIDLAGLEKELTPATPAEKPGKTAAKKSAKSKKA